MCIVTRKLGKHCMILKKKNGKKKQHMFERVGWILEKKNEKLVSRWFRKRERGVKNQIRNLQTK